MGQRATHPTILLTGATGYVGGRLRGRLESRSCRLRCLARRPDVLSPRVDPHTEVRQGDVLAPDTLPAAMEGVDVAYYLVHSMGASSFEERDRTGARNFAEAARAAGVRRIIYLGGLGSDDDALSPHLRSRHEVGEILRSSGVPAIELRASIVLGSGSLSFEMIRSLVETLPAMVTPRWVSVPAQPIAIADILAYLVEAIEPYVPLGVHEVGGLDVVTYRELMLEYARQRGLELVAETDVVLDGVAELEYEFDDSGTCEARLSVACSNLIVSAGGHRLSPQGELKIGVDLEAHPGETLEWQMSGGLQTQLKLSGPLLTAGAGGDLSIAASGSDGRSEVTLRVLCPKLSMDSVAPRQCR